MEHDLRDRVIAFAGIVQSAHLVDKIARTGIADSDTVENSLNSILTLDAETVDHVYGNVNAIKTGLNQLNQLITGKPMRNPDIIRYVLSIIYLEQKLTRNQNTLSVLSSGIERVITQCEHFSILHSNILSSLADLYHKSISTLGPKILINGNKDHLTNADNVNKIRSLLLSGVRSAVLWRQCGGSKIQLVLKRKDILSQTNNLIDEANAIS